MGETPRRDIPYLVRLVVLVVVATWAAVVLLGPPIDGAIQDEHSNEGAGVTVVIVVAGVVALTIAGRVLNHARKHLARRG